jgi:hypothetical protein
MIGRLFTRGAINGRLHTNPDGSQGGFIYDGASVHPTATIEPTAVVMGGAQVKKGQVVANGEIVTSENKRVRFAPPLTPS